MSKHDEFSTLKSIPALTSIFTPPPDCSFLQFSGRNQGGIFISEEVRLSCYPDTQAEGQPAFTYSPGLHCPHGMTTALSVSPLHAVCCCSSNYVYQDNNQCVATLTEGSFTYSSTTVIFSPDETDAIKSFASEVGAGYADPPSIIATAFPITLLDQQLLAGSSEVPTIRSSSANSSSTSPAQMSSYQTNDVSTPLKQNGSFANTPAAFIGLAVGLVGFVVFACLGILYFRRYRKTRLHPAAKDNSTTKDNKWVELGNKPELEGSQVNQKQYTKVELDALVIRAELEGSLGEEQDPVGIGFLKPELQGTPGAWGLLGVFLRRKAELEAPSNSEAEKQGNSRQFNSQQEQSFASRTAEPVELDSESLYRNTNARIISGGL